MSDPFAAPDPHAAPPPGPPPGPPAYGPPPQQWGYAPPPYAYGPPPPRSTNGLAIASLVLGILWLYWIGSVLALVFGYVAKKQIRERGEGGDGLATAGIVLGWIGVGFFSLFFLLGLLAGLGSL